ncbi:MAG: sigma-54-dependent Fis family transcriptional regulator [Alphaproteobacteria bacterium]|nr:sigma-54-dependent Fis family transcriptional regulator [Alphaproteobacteria bacterium]
MDDDQLQSLLLGHEVDLDEVLSSVVHELRRSVGADRATLYLVDHARQELVSHILQADEISEIRLKLGEGVAGWVARNGESLNVPLGRLDPRFSRRVDASSGYRTRSILAAPLRFERAVVGVVQLLNHVEGSFSADDEALLTRVCTELSSVLSRSSLASQLQPDQQQPLSWRFNHIIGESPAMQAAYDRTARAARTDATVLIRGESGTGKELFARAVHYNSPRRGGPFVTVDCASLPDELIENELFGHEKGAYTSADRATDGKVQAAQGGTLFLDEVGELPQPVQAKLLRLVQERTFFRVGGNRAQQADVRFVCATHRDLSAMVATGGFREDLFYRLRVVEVLLPPLRERGHADLDRLIDHFLYELSRQHGRPGMRLSSDARALLHGQTWPGNVRELHHCLESAVVLANGPVIHPDELCTPSTRPGQDDFRSSILPLRDLERAYLQHVLGLCDGNKSEAARRLGIGRNTLLRKLRDEDD